MKTEEMKNQMELNIVMRANYRNGRSKKPRAGWWFSQMRRVVDSAIDWTPKPMPRAHQVYITLDQQSSNF
ncbi:MAG TPA: hypothetical protein VI282_07015 [Verrucomicrobiae bacterium]|jgi:hypothetical protein